jgi:GNAT superfamily N-acetyltransferase
VTPPPDRELVRAWIAGRSLARGLPAPVADRGGWRVETGSAEEVRRYLFARPVPGLVALGGAIVEPGTALKLFATPADLRAALPPRWRIHPTAFFMAMHQPWPERAPPAGYAIASSREGAVTTVRIFDATGEVAASGHAAETGQAFVYDRIATAPDHRRRGLGAALMTALHRARRGATRPELLVATADGRALYETLGWTLLSPYVTATIDPV